MKPLLDKLRRAVRVVVSRPGSCLPAWERVRRMERADCISQREFTKHHTACQCHHCQLSSVH